MKKVTVVLISLLSAFIIMFSGYGKWQRDLVIEGKIEVVEEQNVIDGLDFELQGLESALEKLEEQKVLAVKLKNEKDNEELKQTNLTIEADIKSEEGNSQNNNEAIEPNIIPSEDANDATESKISLVDDAVTTVEDINDIEDNDEPAESDISPLDETIDKTEDIGNPDN